MKAPHKSDSSDFLTDFCPSEFYLLKSCGGIHTLQRNKVNKQILEVTVWFFFSFAKLRWAQASCHRQYSQFHHDSSVFNKQIAFNRTIRRCGLWGRLQAKELQADGWEKITNDKASANFLFMFLIPPNHLHHCLACVIRQHWSPIRTVVACYTTRLGTHILHTTYIKVGRNSTSSARPHQHMHYRCAICASTVHPTSTGHHTLNYASTVHS
jgi:hypothetical protein